MRIESMTEESSVPIEEMVEAPMNVLIKEA